MPLDAKCNGEASVAKHVSGYRYVAVPIEGRRCLCATSQQKDQDQNWNWDA